MHWRTSTGFIQDGATGYHWGIGAQGIGHWLHHVTLHATPGDGVPIVLVRSEHCECAAASCSRVC